MRSISYENLLPNWQLVKHSLIIECTRLEDLNIGHSFRLHPHQSTAIGAIAIRDGLAAFALSLPGLDFAREDFVLF